MNPAFPELSLLAPLLWDVAAKSLLLLALAGMAVLLLRRRSAAVRHMVWAAAMAGLLILPILSSLLPSWRVPWLPPWERAVPAPQPPQAPAAAVQIESLSAAPLRPVISPAPEVDRAPSVGSAEFVPMPPAQSGPILPAEPAGTAVKGTSLTGPAAPRRPVMIQAWLAGVCLALTPLLLGLAAVWRLTRRAQPLDDPDWTSMLRALCSDLALKRNVRLLRFEEGDDGADGEAAIRMPFTWGAFRPVLLLPAACAGWPEERRRMVLLHELAHIKRWDWLTQMAAAAACACYWFNPLAWVAARQMRLERECACDDLVLASVSQPADYADELLRLATHLRAPGLVNFAAVPMARRSSLEGRLRAILDRNRNRKVLTRAMVIAALAWLAVTVVPVAMMRGAEGPAPRQASRIVLQRGESLQLFSGEVQDAASTRLAPFASITLGSQLEGRRAPVAGGIRGVLQRVAGTPYVYTAGLELAYCDAAFGDPGRDYAEENISAWPEIPRRATSLYTWKVESHQFGRPILLRTRDGAYAVATVEKAEANHIELRYRLVKPPDSAAGVGDAAPATARFSDGSLVSILAVTRHAGPDSPWWGPDGGLLERPLYRSGRSELRSFEGRVWYEIVKQIGPSPGASGLSVRTQVRENSGSGSVDPRDEFGNRLEFLDADASLLPEGLEATDISIGIAAGPWRTAVAARGAVESEAVHLVRIAEPVETGAGVFVSVTESFDWDNYNTRFILVLRDGARRAVDDGGNVASQNNGRVIGGIARSPAGESVEVDPEARVRHYTYEFRGMEGGRLTLGDVIEFRFEYRPYEEVTFKNVSLRPGRRQGLEVLPRPVSPPALLNRSQRARAEELIRQLRGGDKDNAAVVAGLAAMGPGVAGQMIPLLANGGTDRPATQVLTRLASDSGVQRLLREAIQAGDRNTRHCALLALGNSSNQANVEFVAGYMQEHPVAAGFALSRLGGPKARERLIAGFDQADTTLWHVLAGQAQEMNDPEAIEPLKKILSRVEWPPNERFPRPTAPDLVRAIRSLEATRSQQAPLFTPDGVLIGHHGGNFQFPFRGPGSTAYSRVFSVTSGRSFSKSVALPVFNVITPEQRTAIYEAILQGAGPGSFTMDGGRLLAFNGLRIAPLTIRTEPPHHHWPAAINHNHVPQRALVNLIEQRHGQNEGLPGPIEGMTAYPLREGRNLFAILSPEEHVTVVNVQRPPEGFAYGVTFYHLDPLYQLLKTDETAAVVEALSARAPNPDGSFLETGVIPPLDRPVSLAARDLPLRDVFAALCRQANLELDLDVEGLNLIGLAADLPVTASFDRAPLNTALGRIFHALEDQGYYGIFRELRGRRLVVTSLRGHREKTARALPPWLKEIYQDGMGGLVVRLDDDSEPVAISVGEKAGDQFLANLKTLPRLRELDIQVTRTITPAGLAHLAELEALEKLNAYEVNADAGLGNEILRAAARIQSLRDLGVSDCGVTDEGVRAIEGMRQLEGLSLSSNFLTDDALKSLSGLVRLRRLDLSGSPSVRSRMEITDDGLNWLSDLRDLQHLSLTGLPVSGRTLSFPRLESLSLSGGLVTDDAVENILRSPGLRQLGLMYTGISDNGLQRMAALKELRMLALDSRVITSAGIAHLKSLPSLEHLDLRATGVTGEAIRHLAEISTLKRLNLHGSGEPGSVQGSLFEVDDVVELRKLPGLRELWLKNFKAPGFLGLRQLSRLESLTLFFTTIGAEEIRQLEEAMPNTRITSSSGGGKLLPAPVRKERLEILSAGSGD